MLDDGREQRLLDGQADLERGCERPDVVVHAADAGLDQVAAGAPLSRLEEADVVQRRTVFVARVRVRRHVVGDASLLTIVSRPPNGISSERGLAPVDVIVTVGPVGCGCGSGCVGPLPQAAASTSPATGTPGAGHGVLNIIMR